MPNDLRSWYALIAGLVAACLAVSALAIPAILFKLSLDIELSVDEALRIRQSVKETR